MIFYLILPSNWHKNYHSSLLLSTWWYHFIMKFNLDLSDDYLNVVHVRVNVCALSSTLLTSPLPSMFCLVSVHPLPSFLRPIPYDSPPTLLLTFIILFCLYRLPSPLLPILPFSVSHPPSYLYPPYSSSRLNCMHTLCLYSSFVDSSESWRWSIFK